jgi:hypothetical protein
MASLETHAPASTHLRILSFTLVGQVEIILKIYSCSTQLNKPQHSSQQTPHAPNHHQDHSEAPVRSNSPVRPNGCFNCGEFGHYANICPKRNMQTPQKDNGQRFGQPLSQARIGDSTYLGNRGQLNYARGRVNHVTTKQAQDAPGFVLDTFPFELCACNSFI